ncbi:unnamed protein product, partial [Ectocarpus sp. 12 AP-2014]
GLDQDTPEDRDAMDVSEAPEANPAPPTSTARPPLPHAPVRRSGRPSVKPYRQGTVHGGPVYGRDTKNRDKLVMVEHETQGPTFVEASAVPSTQKNHKAGDDGNAAGIHGGGRGAKHKAGGGSDRGRGKSGGGGGRGGGGNRKNSGGRGGGVKRKSDGGGGGGDGNDDDGAGGGDCGVAPMEESDDDIASDFGGGFGGGESSDGDVDDGDGSAASTSSSTSSTESTPSPTYHASSIPSSPDTSKQQEDLDDERDALQRRHPSRFRVECPVFHRFPGRRESWRQRQGQRQGQGQG